MIARGTVMALSLALAPVALSFASAAEAQSKGTPAPYAYRQLDDPQQEAAAAALMETLRCLKCQSQSIADSDAGMAGDMRHQVRTRIARGEKPEAIRAWLVERYGDYVSYEPKISRTTWPLFVLPLLLMLLTAVIIGSRLRRAGSADADGDTGASTGDDQ